MQFACANETSSRGDFNSNRPFNLTTPVSQRYVGRQLPNGTSLTSLGTQGESQKLSQMSAVPRDLMGINARYTHPASHDTLGVCSFEPLRSGSPGRGTIRMRLHAQV